MTMPRRACTSCCLALVLVACLLHHRAAAQPRPRPPVGETETEAELLLEIKHAWGDPPALEDWSAAASAAGAHCRWPHVRCDSAGRVTGLYLGEIDVTGPIPDAVGGLSSLVEFDVSDNRITGAFPTALYHCKSLQYLDLSRNNIGGKLPHDIGHGLGANLSLMRLSANRFRGSIPASLSRLRNLQVFELAENLLTGTIPVELGELTRLETLDLSYNPFSAGELPASFKNLTKLVDLRADSCSLIGDLSCVVKMPLLAMLSLPRNSLTGSIPVGVWGLRNLQCLILYSNNLTGTLPVDGFAATRLTIINISDNKLTGGFPEAFGRSESLDTLDLSKNRLTGILPPELGKHLPNLTQLTIDGNELMGAIPEGLCETRFFALSASSNHLNGSIPVCLTNSPDLRILILDDNQLSGEVPESLWTTLERQFDPRVQAIGRTVKLRNNRLTGSLPTTMSSSLVEIDIGNNQFVGRIPSVAVGLMYFDADNNQFSGEIPADLGYGMPLLQRLNLANNKLCGGIS